MAGSENNNEGTHPKKVVDKNYLYNQFKTFYEQISRQDTLALEKSLVDVNSKLNAIINALNSAGIPVQLPQQPEEESEPENN